MDLNQTATAFKQRCADIISSKFILADKKISNLLRLVAASPQLYSLTEDCLRGFNYELEFLKARTPSDEGAFTLRLPEDKQKLAAFAFCLLAEFDSKARDFQGFMDVYFNRGGDYVASFEAFTSDIIKPYSVAMTALLAQSADNMDADAVGVKFFGTEFADFSQKSRDRLHKLCNALIQAVNREKQLPEQEKQDMLTMANALLHSVETADKNLIYALYTGAKHMLKGFKNCVSLMKDLEKVLREYGIISRK